MALSIKISDADFSNFIGRVPPDFIQNAKGLWYFGDETEARTNQITGALSTVLGSPTYANGLVSLSGANGFDTGVSVASGVPFTFIVIGTTSSQSPFSGYVGTWYSGSSIGRSKIYSNVTFAHNGAAAVTALSGTVPTSSGLVFKAQTADASSVSGYVYNGEAMQTAVVPGGLPGTTASYRVGAMGNDGDFNCAAAMLFDVALTSTQVSETYDYLKGVLSSRNIVVS